MIFNKFKIKIYLIINLFNNWDIYLKKRFSSCSSLFKFFHLNIMTVKINTNYKFL
jgi:hypothetical protein